MSAEAGKNYTDGVVGEKQDKLIAGQNIVISEDGKTISATGGGGGGSSVVMVDNADGGVDLTVDGTTKTLAKEEVVSELNNDLTQTKADLRELDEVKADKTSLDETDRSLDMLWKLSKGQTYDIQQKVESGMNIAPKGAQYETLLDVRGESRQESTNGYNLLNTIGLGKDSYEEAGVTFVKQEDGSYIANGTATGTANGWIMGSYSSTETLFTLPAGSYRGRGYSGVYSYDGTTRVNFGSTFTIDKPLNVTGFLVKGYTIGQVVNNEHLYPYLESGTVLHDWEPYTGGIPSPNPDYPQEIHSVEELNFYKSNEHFIDVIEHCNIESNGKLSVSPTADYYIAIIPCGEGRTVKGVWGAFVEYPQTNSYAIGNIRYLSSAITPKGTKYIVVRGSYSTNADFTLDGITYILPTDTSSFVVEKKTIIPPFALNGIGDYYDFADIDNGVWIRNIKSIDIASINLTLHSSEMFWKDFEFDDIRDVGVEEKSLLISDKYYGVSLINFAQYVVGTMAQYSNDTGIRFCNGSKTEKPTGTLSYVSKTPTETPIDSADLEFLKSLHNLVTSENVITITDQNGNDVSYLMEYIVKLNEVN